MSGGITGQSLAKLKRQLTKDIPRRHGLANEAALKEAGQYVMEEAQKRVPYEYGPLHDSAFNRSKGKGFGAQQRVGFSEKYAAAVHEKTRMVLRGMPRPSGIARYWDASAGRGSAKFLQRVCLEKQKEITRKYATAFRRHLTGQRKAERVARTPTTYMPTSFI